MSRKMLGNVLLLIIKVTIWGGRWGEEGKKVLCRVVQTGGNKEEKNERGLFSGRGSVISYCL